MSHYRQGLKTALSIRSCINNEIVYIESGQWPMQVRITKRQLKFWKSIQDITNVYNEHYISKLVKIAENLNVGYLKFYKDLQQRFVNAERCEKILQEEFKTKCVDKIRLKAANDMNSKLGSYYEVNPNLVKPLYKEKLEFERICITRYRTGSHNLKIELGRRNYPSVPRHERLCICNSDIQTLKHCLLYCPLLVSIREKYQIVDVENGVLNANFLIEMERILGLKN